MTPAELLARLAASRAAFWISAAGAIICLLWWGTWAGAVGAVIAAFGLALQWRAWAR